MNHKYHCIFKIWNFVQIYLISLWAYENNISTLSTILFEFEIYILPWILGQEYIRWSVHNIMPHLCNLEWYQQCGRRICTPRDIKLNNHQPEIFYIYKCYNKSLFYTKEMVNNCVFILILKTDPKLFPLAHRKRS